MTRRNDDDMLGTAQFTVGKIPADKRARAVLNVAGIARDAADCAQLLDELGLHFTPETPRDAEDCRALLDALSRPATVAADG